jgi:hypothetical protein
LEKQLNRHLKLLNPFGPSMPKCAKSITLVPKAISLTQAGMQPAKARATAREIAPADLKE